MKCRKPDLITVSPYACFIVIGNEDVAVDEALPVETELDVVDVLLSFDAVDDDFAELVTFAVLDAAEFALSPFLAPQPVTKATASAIGITALNRFLTLINSLSSHVLQKLQQLCISSHNCTCISFALFCVLLCYGLNITIL